MFNLPRIPNWFGKKEEIKPREVPKSVKPRAIVHPAIPENDENYYFCHCCNHEVQHGTKCKGCGNRH